MNYDTRFSGRDSDLETVSLNSAMIDDEDGDRRSRRRLILIALVVLVALVGIWFLIHRSGSGDISDAKKDLVPVVSVIAPGKTRVEAEVNATGTLAAKRDMPVGSVGEGGQVVAVYVEPGQWVRKGQVLAVVDRSVQVQQQASQAAQIQAAKANAELAQANYDRALQLVGRGFISKANVDQLRATRDQAAAQVRVAQAQLGVLRAQTARLNIVAPEAGLILQRKVEPGQTVGAGSGVLFNIAKDGQIELLAELGELDLAKIKPGVEAQVTPVGASHSFTGQVWQVLPVIDPQTREGTVRVELAYSPELRPGGFATATINAGLVDAPILPESAILSDEQGSYVYIVGKDDKVERRAIKTGAVSEAGIAVVSGLNGTERVVLRAGGFLNPGDKVQPQLAKTR